MGGILTDMLDAVRTTARDLRVYLFGRGIITTSAMVAGVLSSSLLGAGTAAALMPYAAVALVGGTLLSGYMRLREMRFNQDEMANLYRDEIADQLGIAPQQVNRTHVHTLAFGDAKRGIAPNPILREEVEREWNKTWLKFATSALAGMASFGLIYFGSAIDLVEKTLPSLLGDTLGKVVGLGSLGIVTGTTGLLLNNGLDLAIRSASSLGTTTLHDRIAKLDRDVRRGKPIAKEQVFALFVAADETLSQKITDRFGTPYDLMPMHQRTLVMHTVGATEQMQAIAEDLNAKRISAGSVAFILAGQQEAPSARKTTNPAAPSPAQHEAQNLRPESGTRFTDRVGAKQPQQPASQTALSHAEREEIRRQSQQLAEAVR